jgi:hypothetical protein
MAQKSGEPAIHGGVSNESLALILAIHATVCQMAGGRAKTISSDAVKSACFLVPRRRLLVASTTSRAIYVLNTLHCDLKAGESAECNPQVDYTT